MVIEKMIPICFLFPFLFIDLTKDINALSNYAKGTFHNSVLHVHTSIIEVKVRKGTPKNSIFFL